MVQKGKFSAGAEAFVNTLKNVDFLWRKIVKVRNLGDSSEHAHPTLGKPTIPHFSDVPKRPNKGPGPSASFFLGGILLLLCLLTPTSSDGEQWREFLINAQRFFSANIVYCVPFAVACINIYFDLCPRYMQPRGARRKYT